MKRSARYISAAFFAGLMSLLMIAAFTAGAVKRSRVTWERTEITISDSMDNDFISGADIGAFLDSRFGSLKGRPVPEISVTEIEKAVDGRSAVKKSEVYMTKDGVLHIDVVQRTPMVRFQKKDGGFYADEDGFLFPLQKNGTAYVPVIDGAVPIKVESGYVGTPQSPEEKEWTELIIRLVRHMNESGVWAENIVQINVRENGDLVMIPREGNERFIFGPPVDIEDKFRKMGLYYTSVVPAKGEGFYSSVNLKFKDRIICRKQDK